MREQRARRRLSPYGLCYGLLLALCVAASGCAADGSAMRADPKEPVVTPADDADTSTAEERADDPGEWRELDTDKGDETVVVTAWLVTTLAGIAAGILGLIALF